MFCMVVQKAQLGLFYQLQIIKKKKFIKWFRYHFYILFGVICFFFEYSIFWIYLYIVTDTADFLQSNIIHIKLEINNICLCQSFILELHYKNKFTKHFELSNITRKLLNFRFEKFFRKCQKSAFCIFSPNFSKYLSEIVKNSFTVLEYDCGQM